MCFFLPARGRQVSSAVIFQNMKNRELAEVLIKVLGIYALLQALPLFQYLALVVPSLLVKQNENLSYLIQAINFIPLLATIIVGFYLIKNGEILSKKLFRDESNELSNQTLIDKTELQTIIFSGIGLLILIMAIPKVIQSIVSIYLYSNETMAGEANRIFSKNWPNILASSLQIVIGLFVFFQAQSITNMWRSIQRMRYEKRE